MTVQCQVYSGRCIPIITDIVVRLRSRMVTVFTWTAEGRRRRFRIDTQVRYVGAHPPFWSFEPAMVKPN